MKIKFTDFEDMLEYMRKEKVKTVDVKLEPFSLSFTIEDLEKRICIITLYTTFPPNLTKSMHLRTRLNKESIS